MEREIGQWVCSRAISGESGQFRVDLDNFRLIELLLEKVPLRESGRVRRFQRDVTRQRPRRSECRRVEHSYPSVAQDLPPSHRVGRHRPSAVQTPPEARLPEMSCAIFQLFWIRADLASGSPGVTSGSSCFVAGVTASHVGCCDGSAGTPRTRRRCRVSSRGRREGDSC